jgi:hypothetical protein
MWHSVILFVPGTSAMTALRSWLRARGASDVDEDGMHVTAPGGAVELYFDDLWNSYEPHERSLITKMSTNAFPVAFLFSDKDVGRNFLAEMPDGATYLVDDERPEGLHIVTLPEYLASDVPVY